MTGGRRADPRSPLDLALRLAPILPEPNALIGALAVTAHGYVRATDDVDFVCAADPKEIQRRLADAGIESAVRRGDFREGDIRSVVHGTVAGIRFDILFPPVPVDWTRTLRLSLRKRAASLRVVDLDSLIRLKLRAGGPQDLIDVVQLLRRHPDAHAEAVVLAEAYGLRPQLETWLADPRIRSPETPPLLTSPKPTARRRAPGKHGPAVRRRRAKV